MKRWTADETRRASEMWAAGMNQGEIAAALGRSPRAVRHCIERHRDLFRYKRQRKNPRKEWSDADIAEASRQWRDGKMSHIIARRFKTTSRAIWELASRHRDLFPYRRDRETRLKIIGARVHNGAGRQRKPVASVIEAIWEGRTLEDIAFEQGVTQQAISSRLARRGLTHHEIISVPKRERAEFMETVI